MQCKLTWDAGVSTYAFFVDSFSQNQVREKSSYVTIDGSLKSYTKWNKWRWELGFDNITPDVESNLSTIWGLDTELTFYPDSTNSSIYYSVYWTNNYEFKNPTDNSHQLTNILYQGNITLEET